MKISTIIVSAIVLVTVSSNCYAQIPFGSAISTGSRLGGSINEKIKDKKRQKSVEAGISQREVNGKSVTVLRVAQDKTAGPAKTFINSAQVELDKCFEQYKEGKLVDKGSAQSFLNPIQALDSDWPVQYYENELSIYHEHNLSVQLANQQRKDSIDLAARKEERRLSDSVITARQIAEEKRRAQEKRERDSLALANITKGYHFVKRPFLQLKEKPSATSIDIGKLYLGTYVRIIDDVASKDYVTVSVGEGLEGFVLRSDLTNNIDSLNATAPELSRFKSAEYYKFEESAAYKAKREALEAKALAEERRAMEAEERAQAAEEARFRKSAPGKTYYTGPKGGCYYMSGGKKVYVDHSYCR